MTIRISALHDLLRMTGRILPGAGLAVFAMMCSPDEGRAACSPPAVDASAPGPGSTVGCSGTTTDQNGGSGYGTGDQSGIIINVISGATVTGTTVDGFHVGSAVVNNAGSITGNLGGVNAGTGAALVTNSGTITGTIFYGVYANGAAIVTNNAGATILGGNSGAYGISATIENFGSITGTSTAGVYGQTDVSVTNHVGATISGGAIGVHALLGTATVTNDGTITGGFVGVNTNGGAAVVVNSGSISGLTQTGVSSFGDLSLTNAAGGSIYGWQSAIHAFANANIVNSGTLTGDVGSAVVVDGAATVTNNAGATITGATNGILGSGSNSSIFNAGTISGGTAAIVFGGSGNTLTLAPTSAITGNVVGAGADTLQLGGTGSGTFDATLIGTQYSGFGTFNKVGASAWSLTGTSAFSGPINVDGGTLAVNGDMSAASALTVNAGGALGGTGLVGTTMVNGGTLAPGNSIGTLTVNGNLGFTAASTYAVEVSPATADRTNATGTATLGGATVAASFAPGSYVAKQYVILNAAGGVSGTFGALVNTNLPSGFSSSLSYDANNAYLNLALGLAQYNGLNVNQQNVANALTDFFNATGGIPAVFGSLTPGGLTQVSGEIATGAQQATVNAMTQFMGVMTDPFTRGRGGDAGTASSYADEAAVGRRRTGAEREAYAMVAKAGSAAPNFERRWHVWAAGYGGTQTTDGHATLGSNTATNRLGGGAVGADTWLSANTLAGLALAGGETRFRVDGLGSGQSDLFQAGVFMHHQAGAAYLAGALAYGWQDITTDRTVTVAGTDQLQARLKAQAVSGRLEGGYRLTTPWDGLGLTPYAAGQFTRFSLPAYGEQVVAGNGTFALNYAANTVTATRSELGLRAERFYMVNDAVVALRGRAAWAHDFDTERAAMATFQTLPGASFVVNGATPASDAALVTASAEILWRNGISLAAAFEGEFSNVTRSYAGKGVARYAW
jgi:uncharacterized protein with beta-barrel porin domain